MTKEEYIERFSSPVPEALKWIEKQTHLRTNHARMLSGPIVGGVLRNISYMVEPQAVLEIGTFTGYSTICLAAGLRKGGSVDAIEINQELEELIMEGYQRAGVSDKICLHFGDAKKIIPSLDTIYDIVYIDANKREYSAYYDLVFDKVRPGGFILADNILWDGKVLENPMPSDAQTMGIEAFNEKVIHDYRVEVLMLPFRDGLSVIRKKC